MALGDALRKSLGGCGFEYARRLRGATADSLAENASIQMSRSPKARDSSNFASSGFRRRKRREETARVRLSIHVRFVTKMSETGPQARHRLPRRRQNTWDFSSPRTPTAPLPRHADCWVERAAAKACAQPTNWGSLHDTCSTDADQQRTNRGLAEMHLPVVAITIEPISVVDRSETIQRSAWPGVSIGYR